MSIIQNRAQLRWYWLCHLRGRVTFDMVRKLVPELFDLRQDECRHSKSRQTEPDWLIDMRNFRRDVCAGKNKCFRRDGEALVLTEIGKEAFSKYVSQEQLRQIAGLKQDNRPNDKAGTRPVAL